MNYEEAIDNLNNKFLMCPIGCAESCEVCRIEAVQLAIEALEKQIPKKPYGTSGDWTNLSMNRCPFCKTYPLNPNDDYCSNCGQAIDWSEVE